MNLDAIKKRFQTYGARVADTAALIAEVEILEKEVCRLRDLLHAASTQCVGNCAAVSRHVRSVGGQEDGT